MTHKICSSTFFMYLSSSAFAVAASELADLHAKAKPPANGIIEFTTPDNDPET